MDDQTYSSYRSLYKQPMTIPMGPLSKYVGNVPLDIGQIITYLVISLAFFILYRFILGEYAVFGIGAPFWCLGISFPLTYWLLKIDTVGKPLHLFLFEMGSYPFRKHWSVGFIPFVKPKDKLSMTTHIQYRPVVQDGVNLQFLTLPVVGSAPRLEGLHMVTSGATRFVIDPFRKTCSIEVGSYDKVQPVVQSIKKYRKTVIDVGKGEVRFMHRKGEVQLIYEPKAQGGG